MLRLLFLLICSQISFISLAQTKWIPMDTVFGALPSSIKVFKTTEPLDGKPNIAWCVIADLNDRNLKFEADTTLDRRMTPLQFYDKNGKPEVVINCTFFSFQTNRNLNLVIKDGRMVSYNPPSLFDKSDSQYHYLTRSAIGIDRRGHADVAWLFTDSSRRWPLAMVDEPSTRKGNLSSPGVRQMGVRHRKWKMETAVGGGPVLIYNGRIRITNNEEMRFNGKAIDDRHPRTAMGYTKDHKLVLLVVEGRNPGVAEGATLGHEASLLLELGCVEALNLDGGGSSCMLVNGKETIMPSDKGKQRPVPAVFIIGRK